jgi:hypothetical protein
MQGKVSFQYLRTHLVSRHPEKLREVLSAALDQAKTANDDGNDNDNETAHRVYASVPKEGYVCGDCDLSFSSVQERLQHCNDAHPIALTSLTCSECGRGMFF